MEKLKADIAKYRGGFENLLVSLHKVTLDTRSKVRSAKYFQSAILSGKSQLNELDRIIGECMKYLSENQELHEDLMQFLVSYRPRLENEINLIEGSIKNPTKYEDVMQDDEMNQVFKDAETEILEMLQEEREKIEMMKREQMEKKSEEEKLEIQRKFEQQQQLKDYLKNSGKQQEQQNKNAWLQDDELQNFREMKRRKQLEQDPDLNFPEYNINLNNDYDKNNVWPTISENEEENTNNVIESEQEMANRLLSQFLGIQTGTDNQNEETNNENNQNEETTNENNQNEETNNENNQNEETNNEENQNEEATNEEVNTEEIQNEETNTERNQNEEIKDGQIQNE